MHYTKGGFSMKELISFIGLNREENPGKKSGLWLIVLAVLGLLLLVGASGEWFKSDSPEKTGLTLTPHPPSIPESSMSLEEALLSQKLLAMLSKIEGAGAVAVSVRLTGTTQSEYALNTTTGKKTTQENDQSGGTRVTSEDTSSNQLVMNRYGQGEQPVVEREVAPGIAGILVVAEGAGNPQVKNRLFQAVKVAMGVEPQKILVLPGGGIR
jgi:stage III sporulation protein AG